MSSLFAAAELRLGRATSARLGNCSVRINGGEHVSGMFTNAPVTATLGAAGAFARSPRVTLAAEYTDGVEEGASVEIANIAATEVYYTVKARQPDELHTGTATLLLEPAA